MKGDQTQRMPVDRRIVVYRFALRSVLLAAAVLFVKFFILDTVVVQTSQMSPTIVSGDRLLFFRLPHLPAFRKAFGADRGDVVVAKPAGAEQSFLCLRVAGLAGDTVSVEQGEFRNTSDSALSFQSRTGVSPLPAEYSPRDQMEELVVPTQGHVYNLDSLSIRDLFFAISLAKHENPGRNYSIKPMLYLDGKLEKDFTIREFSLYKGSLDSVPAPLRGDWFFWERMRAYLADKLPDTSIWLSFALMEDGKRIHEYQVEESCIFLLADDWDEGFDSRYFGPVPVSSLKGGAAMVIWSSRSDSSGGLRTDRFARIIR